MKYEEIYKQFPRVKDVICFQGRFEDRFNHRVEYKKGVGEAGTGMGTILLRLEVQKGEGEFKEATLSIETGWEKGKHYTKVFTYNITTFESLLVDIPEEAILEQIPFSVKKALTTKDLKQDIYTQYVLNNATDEEFVKGMRINDI